MVLKTPRVGEPVQVNEPKCTGIYLLTNVDAQRKVADVQSATDATIFRRDVPWDLISPLDKTM